MFYLWVLFGGSIPSTQLSNQTDKKNVPKFLIWKISFLSKTKELLLRLFFTGGFAGFFLFLRFLQSIYIQFFKVVDPF